MTQLTDKVYAESLPPGNYGDGLIIEVDGKYYLNLIDENGEMLAGTKPLPPGTWRFLFTTKTAKEEDARKVVTPYGKGWKDYIVYHAHKDIPYEFAYDSLRSLLRSKNLNPDKNNYALIEKL